MKPTQQQLFSSDPQSPCGLRLVFIGSLSLHRGEMATRQRIAVWCANWCAVGMMCFFWNMISRGTPRIAICPTRHTAGPSSIRAWRI
jgi:hypothetical protein